MYLVFCTQDKTFVIMMMTTIAAHNAVRGKESEIQWFGKGTILDRNRDFWRLLKNGVDIFPENKFQSKFISRSIHAHVAEGGVNETMSF